MNWQNEFPQHHNLVYLNHAAVGPWPQRAATAVSAFAQENVVQGAAAYPEWLKVEQQLRKRLKALINAPDSDDIALQKNTSEALSVIAYGLNWQPGDNVVISSQEFPSNRLVWESLARFGVNVKVAELAHKEDPDQAVIDCIDHRTRLLSISSVQYASGLKMDCQRLGKVCKQRNILFCIDAIQSIGAQVFDVQAYQADFVVADGHKWMLGPEGLALFYSTPEARQQLQLNEYGWHMVKHRGNYDRLEWEPLDNAQRFECGSPNMLCAYALNASLSLLEEVGMPQVEQQLQQRVQYLLDGLGKHPDITVISPTTLHRRAGIVTFRHKLISAPKLHQTLMDKNIICAHRGGGVRFSPHFYIPFEKLDEALNLLD
ncbi:Cysteine desulfurase [gamma proteobacterium IMCC2047]|nr:Cysteine desulfurase [gamma proteobacterium IMCC2047]